MQRVLVIVYTPQFPYYSAQPVTPESDLPRRCGVGVSFEACYFEPLSSCSWRDATEGISDSIPSINSRSQVTNPALKTVQMSGHFTASDYHCQAVPPQFHSLLRRGPIQWDKKHYWWRAQSVAYIARPNARTLAELAMRKRRVYPGRQIKRGTISVHVRHGDKHIESTPIPDEACSLLLHCGGFSPRLRPSLGVLRDPTKNKRQTNISIGTDWRYWQTGVLEYKQKDFEEGLPGAAPTLLRYIVRRLAP
ncbi:hypothetical protein COCOBI_19-2270 [Coccomyxa sp. Obi]|nr:hypothetical protein COCOBI_19-2270 [Coccomyxa sp. Obi]